MKAYVIKNKEGKYFTISLLDSFTDDIRESCIFQDWEGADHDLDRNEFEDCEIVEITITEGDLEQGNKQLEEQLAKKDKEIETLNKLLKDYMVG